MSSTLLTNNFTLLMTSHSSCHGLDNLWLFKTFAPPIRDTVRIKSTDCQYPYTNLKQRIWRLTQDPSREYWILGQCIEARIEPTSSSSSSSTPLPPERPDLIWLDTRCHLAARALQRAWLRYLGAEVEPDLHDTWIYNGITQLALPYHGLLFWLMIYLNPIIDMLYAMISDMNGRPLLDKRVFIQWRLILQATQAAVKVNERRIIPALDTILPTYASYDLYPMLSDQFYNMQAHITRRVTPNNKRHIGQHIVADPDCSIVTWILACSLSYWMYPNEQASQWYGYHWQALCQLIYPMLRKD